MADGICRHGRRIGQGQEAFYNCYYSCYRTPSPAAASAGGPISKLQHSPKEALQPQAGCCRVKSSAVYFSLSKQKSSLAFVLVFGCGVWPVGPNRCGRFANNDVDYLSPLVDRAGLQTQRRHRWGQACAMYSPSGWPVGPKR